MITKKELEANLGLLCRMLGTTEDWRLDHVACYGGYIVENRNGGTPLGSSRLTNREMLASLQMAIRLVEYQQNTSKEAR